MACWIGIYQRPHCQYIVSSATFRGLTSIDSGTYAKSNGIATKSGSFQLVLAMQGTHIKILNGSIVSYYLPKAVVEPNNVKIFQVLKHQRRVIQSRRVAAEIVGTCPKLGAIAK